MSVSKAQNPGVNIAILVAAICAITFLPSRAPAQAEALRGSAIAVDGRVLVINGKKVTLANITVPELGSNCLMRGKLRDCGKFAQLGLTELVVAATIECRRSAQQKYSCRTEDGYDLALGQIHAGWAVPTSSAPLHYFTKMQEARTRKRMLWSAQMPDGGLSVATTLLNQP